MDSQEPWRVQPSVKHLIGQNSTPGWCRECLSSQHLLFFVHQNCNSCLCKGCSASQQTPSEETS